MPVMKSSGEFVYIRGTAQQSGGLRRANFTGGFREVTPGLTPGENPGSEDSGNFPESFPDGFSEELPENSERGETDTRNRRISSGNITRNIKRMPAGNKSGSPAPQPLTMQLADDNIRKAKNRIQNRTGNSQSENEGNAGESLPTREEIIAEYEELKRKYIQDGEEIIAEAKRQAEAAVKEAQAMTRQMNDDCLADCQEMRREALDSGYKTGHEKGYEEGREEGYDTGFTEAIEKCRGALEDLTAMISELPRIKEQMFMDYEHQLFDSIFTIAQKVTVGSLKQKDKGVVQKLLKETAKNFHQSEFIKVTLSKLDVDRMAEADSASLAEIFKFAKHVEFEISKDEPEGTVIVEDDSEKIDSSIGTQLRMIEKLGKGKFRD